MSPKSHTCCEKSSRCPPIAYSPVPEMGPKCRGRGAFRGRTAADGSGMHPCRSQPLQPVVSCPESGTGDHKLYLEKGTLHFILSRSYPLHYFSVALTSNMVSMSGPGLRLMPQLLTHHLAYECGGL